MQNQNQNQGAKKLNEDVENGNGNEKEVENLIKLCEKGSPSSKVDQVNVNEYKRNYLKKSFDIIKSD